METKPQRQGFGTMPVFLATISTILGAILFLRFGYAIAHVGFWGVMGIIVLGHIVTLTTAMAVAEIATNQRVEGGGAYFIISRSFGLNIGGAIGIALFIAQAISVAFYVIALGEAFTPIVPQIQEWIGSEYVTVYTLSILFMGILTALILTKGADLGVKSLYIVVAILFVSIILFFLGTPDYTPPATRFTDIIENPNGFFYVFTIIFPAFTGIAAGLGLSGDLEEPRRSIPLGTLSATIFGMVVYVFIAWKLTVSASPEDLASDYLYMQKIAAWGPAILIGLGAAALSSALGSIMIAPRTLQALGKDKVFPGRWLNDFCARGFGKLNEPIYSSVITCAIAFVFVFIGDIDFVAQIISMFFIVTYGAICLISFLEHFAADPAYRPTFRSRWYLSLIGAVVCFGLMFLMNFAYATLSVLAMVGIYLFISYFKSDSQGMAKIFQGVIFQVSRSLRVLLQRSEENQEEEHWRPAVISISTDSFERLSAFDVVRWISRKYGFGTFIHLIIGYLSKSTSEESQEAITKLKRLAITTKSNVFVDTLVSPSYTSAIAQAIQLPGISGKDNNLILFEFPKNNTENLKQVQDNFALIKSLSFDVCILRSSDRVFGYKKSIDIWITSKDTENANLLILLGYIIQGHEEWKYSEIKIATIADEDEIEESRKSMENLISGGRLPISKKNIEFIVRDPELRPRDVINANSSQADLTIIGFRSEAFKKHGTEIFDAYPDLGNILFVNSTTLKRIN